MTWMWKWGTSWKAASPSATKMFTPSTRRPEPRMALSSISAITQQAEVVPAARRGPVDRGPVRLRRHRLGGRHALLSTAPPAPVLTPPVAPPRPREPLDLGADADPLAGGDHGADAGHQPVGLGVLEERPEELRGAADDGLGVTDDDQQLLGPGDGDVNPVRVVEEADRGPVVGADEREDDGIRLAPL